MAAAAASSSSPSTPSRSKFKLAASVLLIAAACGALVGVLVFYQISGSSSTSPIVGNAPAHASNQDEHAAVLESATTTTNTAAACETQSCKVGGSEVCGTDGKTYLNECFFQNAKCRNPSLEAVADWKGYNCPNTCTKHIACREIGKFLCATDGNVYFGYCNLYIAQCLDASIEEVPCDPAIFKREDQDA